VRPARFSFQSSGEKCHSCRDGSASHHDAPEQEPERTAEALHAPGQFAKLDRYESRAAARHDK